VIEIIPNWHPVFVHFTITLLTLSGILQCIIWAKKPSESSPIWFARKWLNVLGILSILVTAMSGYYAYNSVLHDDASHVAMTIHRNWAIATLITFVAGASISLIFNQRYLALSGILLVISFGLVTITGYKGGELVYRYGLGVLSLPKTDLSHHEDNQTKPPSIQNHHHDHGDHHH